MTKLINGVVCTTLDEAFHAVLGTDRGEIPGSPGSARKIQTDRARETIIDFLREHPAEAERVLR